MRESLSMHLHSLPMGHHHPQSFAAVGPPPLHQATAATACWRSQRRTSASEQRCPLRRSTVAHTQVSTAQPSSIEGRVAERAMAARWTWGQGGTPRLIRLQQHPAPCHCQARRCIPAEKPTATAMSCYTAASQVGGLYRPMPAAFFDMP